MSIYKILLVGDKEVGKVSFKNKIMAQFNDNDPNDPAKMTTRFLSWTIDHRTYQLEFKIVEPDELPTVRDSFYRTASGFICMFSIDNAESFKVVEKMREQIFDVRPQTRIVLVGNKCDQAPKQRKVPKRDAKRLAKKWKAEYIETSVNNNQNLEDCLNVLLQAILENKHTAMVRGRTSLKNTLDRFKYYNCFQ